MRACMLAFPLVLLARDRLWTRFIRSRKSATGWGFLSSAPSLWLDQCDIHMASGERVLFRAMGKSPSPSFLERVSLKDLLCYSLLRILFGEHGRSLHCCIDHSDRCPRSVLRPSKLTVAAIRVLSHWVQQIRHLWLATASRLRVHRPQCRCAHSRLERLACGVRWGTKALTSAAARFSFTASPAFVCRSWNRKSFS
jgi:hypothetical protein